MAEDSSHTAASMRPTARCAAPGAKSPARCASASASTLTSPCHDSRISVGDSASRPNAPSAPARYSRPRSTSPAMTSAGSIGTGPEVSSSASVTPGTGSRTTNKRPSSSRSRSSTPAMLGCARSWQARARAMSSRSLDGRLVRCTTTCRQKPSAPARRASPAHAPPSASANSYLPICTGACCNACVATGRAKVRCSHARKIFCCATSAERFAILSGYRRLPGDAFSHAGRKAGALGLMARLRLLLRGLAGATGSGEAARS